MVNKLKYSLLIIVLIIIISFSIYIFKDKTGVTGKVIMDLKENISDIIPLEGYSVWEDLPLNIIEREFKEKAGKYFEEFIWVYNPFFFKCDFFDFSSWKEACNAFYQHAEKIAQQNKAKKVAKQLIPEMYLNCYKLEEGVMRSFCLSIVKKNYVPCLDIKNNLDRNWCLTHYACAYTDESVCNNINDTEEKNNCLQKVNILFEKERNHALNCCNKRTPECNNIEDTDERLYCIILHLQTSKSCQYLKNLTLKNECFKVFNLTE